PSPAAIRAGTGQHRGGAAVRAHPCSSFPGQWGPYRRSAAGNPDPGIRLLSSDPLLGADEDPDHLALQFHRGSVPVIALFHASIDTAASSAILTSFYPGVDGRLLYVALAVVALAVVLLTRGR